MARDYGKATSEGFLLQEATLMLGPMGEYRDLLESDHSVGLFKNMQVQNTRTYTSLNQGTRQKRVHSTLTEDTYMLSGEGYEFGPRQLKFALGQEGYLYTPTSEVKTTLSADALGAQDEVTLTSSTGFAVGDFIIVRPKVGHDSGLAYRITALAANVATLDRDLVEVLPTGSEVFKSTIINSNEGGNNTCNGASYMSAKVVSQMANCKPIILYFPKVQITSGLNLSFGASDYSNMPYELTSYALVPTDPGYDDYLENGENDMIVLTT